MTKVLAGSAPSVSAACRKTSGAGFGFLVGVSSAEKMRPAKNGSRPVFVSIISSRSVLEFEQMQRGAVDCGDRLVRALDGAHLGCQPAVDQRLGLVDQRGLERDGRLLLDPQHDVLKVRPA